MRMVYRDPKRRWQAAGACAFILCLIWQHVQATKIGYQVAQSRSEIHALRGRISSLRKELAKSLSPAQLARKASEQGMYPAPPDSLRQLPPETPRRSRKTFLSRLIPRSWRTLVSPLET